METTESREFLWTSLSRLSGIVRPRMWHWRSEGQEAGQPGSAGNVAVLGQDWLLGDSVFAATVLDRVGAWLSLDGSVWRAQRPFLKSFVCSFFGATDRPAWIKVHAVRTGFQRRSADANNKARHLGQLGRRRVWLTELPWSGIELDGKKHPAHGVRLFHPSGVPERSLELRRVYVHRVLRADALGASLTELEERLVVVTDDPNDRRLASRGMTPGLEPFRDRITDVYSAPLVSFSRIDERGRIAHRCFSVRPGAGEILDMRACAYKPEYYFRSDMTCHTMLEKLLTPGEYGTF